MPHCPRFVLEVEMLIFRILGPINERTFFDEKINVMFQIFQILAIIYQWP